MQTFFKALAAIVGAENIFTDPADTLAACVSPLALNTSVLACVRPHRGDQVGKILELCAQRGQHVAFRGGGTAWNSAPREGSLVVLTDGLNRIYTVDATSQVIHLQPGVICQAAQDAAAREGLFLPGLPLSAQVATIGGAVACNAAGPDTARYGFLASRVLSLDAWLTSGKKISCFAARGLPGELEGGLPLASLLVGSAGSLAFIGDMRLRLCLEPPVRSRILASGPWEQLVAAAPHLAALQPAELYLLNREGARALGTWPEALLYAELHEPGQEEQARNICASLRLLDDVAGFVEKRAGLMAALYAQYGRFLRETCAFPPSLLPQFAAACADIAARHGSRLAIAVNGAIAAADIFIFPPQSPAVAQDLFALELMLNDALGSEDDATLTRAQWRKRGGGRDLSRQIRNLFDPAAILLPCAGAQ